MLRVRVVTSVAMPAMSAVAVVVVTVGVSLGVLALKIHKTSEAVVSAGDASADARDGQERRDRRHLAVQ